MSRKGVVKGATFFFIGIFFLFGIYALIVGIGASAPLPWIEAQCNSLNLTVYQFGTSFFIIGLVIILMFSFSSLNIMP